MGCDKCEQLGRINLDLGRENNRLVGDIARRDREIADLRRRLLAAGSLAPGVGRTIAEDDNARGPGDRRRVVPRIDDDGSGRRIETREEQMMRLLSDGPMRAADIAESMGVTREYVHIILKNLVHSVESIRSGRFVHYCLKGAVHA